MSGLSLNFIRGRLESNRQLLEACERPEGRLAKQFRLAIGRDEAELAAAFAREPVTTSPDSKVPDHVFVAREIERGRGTD